MKPLEVDVVVRCKNELPYTARTLEALARQQGATARILFYDDGSTDGSLECARSAGAELLPRLEGPYVPGRVLNHAMRFTRSPVVAFINADAVPLGADSLVRLVQPLLTADVAASYGRQLARPTAARHVQRDHARAFPASGAPSLRYGAFFSLAASALQRRAWEAMNFDESLAYSEDVDWATRARYLGYSIVYASSAKFEHSHDYSLSALWRRRRGEAAAATRIFRLERPSVLGDWAVPLAGEVLRDLRAGTVSAAGLSARLVQSTGWFAGRVSAYR